LNKHKGVFLRVSGYGEGMRIGGKGRGDSSHASNHPETIRQFTAARSDGQAFCEWKGNKGVNFVDKGVQEFIVGSECFDRHA
jgi:hypothetical protein